MSRHNAQEQEQVSWVHGSQTVDTPDVSHVSPLTRRRSTLAPVPRAATPLTLASLGDPLEGIESEAPVGKRRGSSSQPLSPRGGTPDRERALAIVSRSLMALGTSGAAPFSRKDPAEDDVDHALPLLALPPGQQRHQAPDLTHRPRSRKRVSHALRATIDAVRTAHRATTPGAGQQPPAGHGASLIPTQQRHHTFKRRGLWGHVSNPQRSLAADLSHELDGTLHQLQARLEEKRIAECRTNNVRRMIRAIMLSQKPQYRPLPAGTPTAAGGSPRHAPSSRTPTPPVPGGRRPRLPPVARGVRTASKTGTEPRGRSPQNRGGRSSSPAKALSLDNTLSNVPDLGAAPSPRRKHYLRSYFRWAVSNTIARLRDERELQVQQAKQEVERARLAAEQREEAARVKERRSAVTQLFGNLKKKIASGAYRRQVLTEDRYEALRDLIAIICGKKKRQVLSLSEITALMADADTEGFDATTFRKLDRDHSGYLELDEIVHGFFPTATAREIRAVRAQLEEREAAAKDRSASLAASRALSSASKAMLAHFFSALDHGRKGVLTLADFERAFPTPEQRAPMNLAGMFPRPGVCLTLPDFMEFLKYAFPPFSANGSVGIPPSARGNQAGAAAGSPRHYLGSGIGGLPAYVVQAQSIMTSAVE